MTATLSETGHHVRDIAPVLISGAGPVGCCAALMLAQNGIPVILFEAKKELPIDLRASTFHPPTLDMLDRLGLTERLIPQGLIVREFQYRERRSGQAAKFNMINIKDHTRHPYRLQCEQFKMTRTVFDMLEEYPHAKIMPGVIVKGFQDDGAGVKVLTFDGKQERVHKGSFLIAADGANSSIRQASATAFPGLTYPERFLVASTKFRFEDHFDGLSWVNYVSDPDEWCVMLKTPGLWRIQFPTDPDNDEEILLSDDYIQSRLQRLCPAGSPYKIEHRTLYRVHQRVAETYRVARRTVLAGDAAHVNNPLGGMGMNGGIHDAINLGEKLIGIIAKGKDLDRELDLYDLQRRKICVDFIQKKTRENKRLMEATEKSVQEDRQKKFMAIAGSATRQKDYLMESSMIDSLRQSYEIAAA